MDVYTTALEIKFADAAAGAFSGIASPYGNVDAHGDMVAPGAFAASLAQHKAAGTMPALYVCHGPATGADPLPVGVWDEMEEAADGLRVKGRISALDTDYGRRVRALVADGALRALSIGYKVAPGGASYGKPPREPRRTLKSLSLIEVSLVPMGSNPRARVEAMKSAHGAAEIEEIKSRVAAGDMPTEREWERAMRDAFGLSRAQSALVADRGFKALARESNGGKATPQEVSAALRDLGASLGTFALPSFGRS